MSSFDEAGVAVISEYGVPVMSESGEAEDGVRCALSRRRWDRS
jgi:hypothetical protein